MNKLERTCKETLSVQTHRIMPFHTNSFGNLFGGQLLYFLDNAASIAAGRLTNSVGMTASIDHLNFVKPLPEGNSVCIESYATGTGSTSCEVFTKVVGEDLISGERYIAATAFTTFVTIPVDKENFIMPAVVAESDEEKFLCAGYQARKFERIKKRDADHELNAKLSVAKPWLN